MIPLFRGDQIGAFVYTTAAVTINIAGRQRTANGTPKDITTTTYVPSAVDGSKNSHLCAILEEGELLSLNLSTVTSAIQRGQCFVIVGIFSINDKTTPQIVLFADYVTSKTILSFPGSAITSPTQGRGRIGTVAGTITSQICSMLVPANVTRRILAAEFDITTDANTNARQFMYLMSTGGGGGLQVISPTVMAPSGLYTVHVGNGLPHLANSGIITTPNIERGLMIPGDSASGSIVNHAAGDNFSDGFFQFEEWIIES